MVFLHYVTRYNKQSAAMQPTIKLCLQFTKSGVNSLPHAF